MPVFTGTPIDIAPSPPAPPFLWFNYENNFRGPYKYFSNLYMPGLVPSGSPNYQVAKSTDDGATWTLFGSGSLDIGTYIGAILDAANDEIVMFGIKTSNTIKVIYFDLITETFSSVFTLSTGTLETQQLSLVQRPDGDIIAFYSKHNDGFYAVKVSHGGTFGTPVLIEAEPGGGTQHFRARNAVVDSGNISHILYWEGPSPRTLRYNTLSSGYVAGIAVEAVASGDPFSFFQFANPLLWAGKLVSVDQVSDPCRILVGDPASGPTWTFHDVHTVVTDLPDLYAAIVDFGATLRIFYMHQGFTTTDVLQVMYVDWDGSSFTTPAIWWDIIADPPTGTTGIDPADFEVFGITAALDPDTGATQVCIIVTVDEFDSNQSDVFASVGGSSDITLSPGSGSIALTGGTPSINILTSTRTQTGVANIIGGSSTTLTPGPGSITITGGAPTINVGNASGYKNSFY